MTDLPNKTELEEPGNLIPYSNNPKEHPEGQIDEIASSIKNYGFVQPVVVDSENEVIIGHGRLKAAKKLGLDEIPVIRHDDITESEAKALRLADNKIAESEWEDEKLAVELEQLTEADDYEDLIHGFDEDEMSEYLDSLTDEKDLEEPEAEDPEQVETDIQEGEVFNLGEHRLMCGDATNEEHVETLMDGDKADMVFTDPPYGIEFHSNHGSDHDKIENDDEILKIKPMLKTNTINKCHWYIFTGHQVYPVWRKQFQDEYKSTVIWKKPAGSMGDLGGDYKPMYEMCLYCQIGNKKLNGGRDENIWEINRDNPNNYTHPTQKPVELPAKAIQNSSNQKDIVLDLFAGSGSTLLAAEQTDRKAYCMELDPEYCQVIINRWEDLTGKNAEPVT